jgi:hypothetical protein
LLAWPGFCVRWLGCCTWPWLRLRLGWMGGGAVVLPQGDDQLMLRAGTGAGSDAALP